MGRLDATRGAKHRSEQACASGIVAGVWQGLGFRVQGLGFRVGLAGFGAWGFGSLQLGFGVWAYVSRVCIWHMFASC